MAGHERRLARAIAAIPLVLLAVGSPAARTVSPAQDRTPPAAAGDATPGTAAARDPAPPDGAPPAARDAIPLLTFKEPAAWVKVEIIDNVTGGCFLQAAAAEEYAIRRIGELGQTTTGDEGAFHVVFRIRATGARTRDGRCFGAIFFEELYPVDVVVRPGAEPYRSRWPGRLGLQKLVLQEGPFDREVRQVVDDGIGILFRER